jgi:serine/threonine protein kinase
MSRPPRGDRREITAGQWQRLEVLLESALQLPPAARIGFLDTECADDSVLRAELESLLASDEKTGPLDRPILRLTRHGTDPLGAEMPMGGVVSHYEIQERLGSGGMGVVYRARDLRLGRTVALNFLPPALSGDARAKKRFLTEARAAAALEHSNVCTVHEIGETAEGQLFIAMAFVEGESLRELLERSQLPVERALDIARQIAQGLECAHRHAVVHRDVKPANVMIAAAAS